MKKHEVLLSEESKINWFIGRIEERRKVKPFDDENELIDCVRSIRNSFRRLFERDVSGTFITKLMNRLGCGRNYSPSTLAKRKFMYSLMDKNKAFRENKTQTRKALQLHFNEDIVDAVFNELWDEYHSSDQVESVIDIDLYGQKSIFD